jgi:hypothetical protein
MGNVMQVERTATKWTKWLPSDPTSPHWYQPAQLERLVAAYIAHDADRGSDRTVRELVAEFRGLSSTGKQKRVLDETGLGRTNLSNLVRDGAVDVEAVKRLLEAMRHHSKPIKPVNLGIIGEQHLAARLGRYGCQMDTFRYRRTKGETDGLPWVVETAFGYAPDQEERRLVTGVNWSPGIVNPFRVLGAVGRSLDSLLECQRAGDDEPIVLVLHVACPYVEYTDRGKSAVVIAG